MYGKLMSISDPMMWRYYELLTDVQVADIEKMKRESHPMQAKKELARRIVGDFHSPDAAARAGEDWGKQFQKNEVPEEIERVVIALEKIKFEGTKDLLTDESSYFPLWKFQGDGASNPQTLRLVRLDKLLLEAGLVPSRTEASRKIKEKAVRLIRQVVTDPIVSLVPGDILTSLGRRAKIVRIADSQ
jgi:tyrosyl-tRNA synthetase